MFTDDCAYFRHYSNYRNSNPYQRYNHTDCFYNFTAHATKLTHYT